MCLLSPHLSPSTNSGQSWADHGSTYKHTPPTHHSETTLGVILTRISGEGLVSGIDIGIEVGGISHY